jgi:hypothetical protein
LLRRGARGASRRVPRKVDAKLVPPCDDVSMGQQRTIVTIRGEDFHVNGEPTYKGRSWKGLRIEGLLMNARLVQGTFDDLNPATCNQWAYPDGAWDPQRNTSEFLAAMPSWREHGLLAFTLNLQGGSPQGYSKQQPWHNSAFDEHGELREAYVDRTARILDRADELGMAVILGCFYFGQDHRLVDEQAVQRALDNTTDLLLQRGDRHVLVEINNECNVLYTHPILKPDRVHELIARVRDRSGGALLAGTSYGGNTVVRPNVAAVSDFILMHGNGVSDPQRIGEMVREARQVDGYRGQPIVFNEDDHYGFDHPDNNMLAAVREHASWGFFDWRRAGEAHEQGYQCVPVDWSIGSERKRGFFGLLKEMTVGA